jgi:hypothetical protein
MTIVRGNGMDEKETAKYKKALELVVSLEEITDGGYSKGFVEEMNAAELYDYLRDEWWHSWNGLLQEWEDYEEPPE